MTQRTTATPTVTLSDVAARAGVSLATASRVINNSAKPVAPELRTRVLSAVEDLHYVPNVHAQNLARAQRTAVGVIVHDVSDPYFAEITRGLQRVAAAHGRLLLICNSYRDPERELEYVALLRAQQCQALVLAGSGYHDPQFAERLDEHLRALEAIGVRVSAIGRHDLRGATVRPENEAGAFALGERLFATGHTRAGVVAGPRILTTITDRLAGLRRAAELCGRELPDEQVVYADFSRDGGEAATHTLLDAAPGTTAVVALNDAMAVGVLAAARARGLRVPEELSVLGFDDMPIARDVTPALTTVRLPLVEMGERAMTLVLSEDADSGHDETVPATVVWRDSCAPPRRMP